jgi:hypothetical protein
MDRTLPATRQSASRRTLRSGALAIAGTLLIGSLTTPALAASDVSTRVVRCGSESCLLVTGHRDDPSAIVTIEGQQVAVEGKYGWKARVPVATVKEWCGPYAREIEVSLHNPATRSEITDNVDLPIGLLGSLTDLASLEISVN